MAKCQNNCDDPAEQNFTWITSRGPQSANLCGVCAALWWSTYKHTPSGQSLTICPVNSYEIEPLTTT